MKTIKINGVEFRITRETSDTTVNQHYRFGVEPSGGSFNVNQIIDAAAPGIEVSISGHPDAVKSLFVAPPDPQSLIQRALSALGYVVGDHEKDVAQFSQWVDHLAEFPRSEESLELWTKSVLALLPSNKSIEGASLDARDIVIQRMRLFPLAPKTGLDDGPPLPEPWAELQEWRSAAKRCGIASAKELAGTVAETFGQFVDRRVTREWQEATGCNAPEEASRVKADKIAQWQAATGCNTPEVARLRIGQLNRFLDDWQIKSGVASPDALIEKFRITEDAWKEATGAMDTHSAYKRIQELESKLLSYAGEIDALRKASSTMVRDPALEMRACDAEHEKRVSVERDLGKVRAELQSKCREAQTERERADKLEAREHALWTSIHRVREAAGLSFGEEILLLIEQWCSNKRREIDKIREALGVVGADDADLPGHVADLKRAYDKLDPGPPSLEDRAKEANEIGEIISSHLRDSGIEVVANVLANRYHYLSSSWTKTMQAREILGAKHGESVVDAAKRAIAEAKAAVDGATQDAKSYWSMVVSGWEQCTGCATPEEAREKIASAIIPLPKPEKVEPGQKWAFVMTATSGTEDGNVYLVGRFRNAWGNHYGALTYDIRTGFYLGT